MFDRMVELQKLGDDALVDAAKANVLNVILEPDARANVILKAAKCIRDGGTAYFTVYEGDGSGEGRQTSSGWQNNRKTADYVSEIGRYFDGVQRKGKLIIATNPKENLPKASWEVEPGHGVRFSVREFEDGRKYVKADWQVLFGNNQESWSERLEDYINVKIRRGQDVRLIAEDGDILLLRKRLPES